MAISVYLLLGLTWGLLYIVILQYHPEAFSFGGSAASTSAFSYDQQGIFATLVYFSLTTLTTIGYGDISPLTLQARYAAVAEGITGQFYLAILVARLVGMQMSSSMNRDTGNQPRTPETESSVDRGR
jgi:voltage-gated potassium channel